MQPFATAIRILITGSIAGFLLLSGTTLTRHTTTDAFKLAIFVAIVIGSLQLLFIRVEHAIDNARTNALDRRLQDIGGEHQLINLKLNRTLKALGRELKPVHISIKAEFDLIASAYATRHKYDSHGWRKWMYLLAIRRSLALEKSQADLSDAERRVLLTGSEV